MAGKIFISYRRDDARADARSIRDRLARVFGESNVFMDVDQLRPGQRFDHALRDALAQCDVFLCVIGPRWTELMQSRAGAEQHDYVRQEVASALTCGALVIPVLIAPTPLPRPDELPDDVRALVLHQKQDISHERFGRDVLDLIEAIKVGLRARKAAFEPRRIGSVSAVVAAVTLVLGGLAYHQGLLDLTRGTALTAPLADGPPPSVARAASTAPESAAAKPTPSPVLVDEGRTAGITGEGSKVVQRI